jgi:hypothetical protein
MSEHDEDQGKWVGAFLLGVLVGALLMLGIGGGLWTMQARRTLAMEERAREAEMRSHEEAARALVEHTLREEAERARLEAERVAREEAERARREAERAAHERAKAAKGPAGAKDGK